MLFTHISFVWFHLSVIEVFLIARCGTTSMCHFFCLSIPLSVVHPNHNFWYTCVKWYLQAFFSFFFLISVFQAVTGVKGQKMAQNEKLIYHAPYLRKGIAYDHEFWYTCENDGIYKCLFHFLSSWGSKRAKNSPKWKITITSIMHHISGTV